MTPWLKLPKSSVAETVKMQRIFFKNGNKGETYKAEG
jgi:hypothetical protein